MSENIKCLLCDSKIRFFATSRNRKYYKCENCLSLMLDPSDFVSSQEEKARYETHNNDVEDIGYQKFVSPIVESVREDYSKDHLGLDYGAGTGPVITSLLEKEDYGIKLYDPFFHPYPENLLKKYDYIICSEVIEHFHRPYQEFKNLKEMLNPRGSIFCLTSLYHEGIDFENWNYKNDETHVFFYHKKALEWIKNQFDFSQVEVEGKLIKFRK